jgi:hypothetical protein
MYTLMLRWKKKTHKHFDVREWLATRAMCESGCGRRLHDCYAKNGSAIASFACGVIRWALFDGDA